MNKMYKYLRDHNYISRNENKDALRQQELSRERAKCIANKYDSLIDELQQENKQLKIQASAREEVCNRLENNWNKLKEYIDIKLYNVEYLQKLCGCRIDDETHMILDIIKKEMQKLEGSDSNGQ